MYYYAFTLDKTSKPVYPSHYENFIKDLKEKYPRAEIIYVWEEGQKRQNLHIHGQMKSEKCVYINRIHPGIGYSLDFKPVKNKAAWKTYCSKQSLIESDTLQKWRRIEVEDLFKIKVVIPDGDSEDESTSIDPKKMPRIV